MHERYSPQRERDLTRTPNDQASAHRTRGPACTLFLRMNSTFNSRREFAAREAAALSSAQDSRATLSDSICNYSWQTTTPEGNHTAAARATGGASTRGHHLVSHQTAQSPSRSTTLQSQSGSQSRAFSLESYRLAIHSVKPHRLFHTMHRQEISRSQSIVGRVAGCGGGRIRVHRRHTPADQPLRGTERPEH
jgi:hypothetical protein